MTRDPYSQPSAAPEPVVQEALGRSEAFLTFQEQLSRAAKVDRPVLLLGERGTGKELAASRLHYLSPRWQESFVALNCSALAASLIEAELFGHEEGAFTGATRRRTGRFEAANGGTLFLDEIGNIPKTTQEKILRVVEYGGFERVGSSDTVKVDVRIIGATNVNLADLADEGRFMRDLLDRLSFEVLFIPPLRERVDDIVFLANHFGGRMAYELDWGTLPEITEGAARKMEEYHWPGNVRELKNVIERAVYRSDDHLITDDEIIFDPFDSPYATMAPAQKPGEQPPIAKPQPIDPLSTITEGKGFEETVREFEVALIRKALKDNKYNQRRAAERLDLTYHQFRGLYRKYGKELEK